MALDKLVSIGFKQVGEWVIENEKLLPKLLAEKESENVLYCFVVNQQPMYIGKTTQPLKKRLYGYQNPGKTQFTNIRNNARILDELSRSNAVDIYVLPDNGLLHFGVFHLNLAAGLEDSITKMLKPKWNLLGK